MTHNNRILNLVNISAYANLVKLHQFVIKRLSENEILTSIKDHKSVINLRKLMRNNPSQELVNINGYVKCGQIPSICSQDMSRN